MKLPYQIQRTRLAEHGDDAYYRFDLVHVGNGTVLAYAFSRSAVAPARLAKRVRELNARLREIEKCK